MRRNTKTMYEWRKAYRDKEELMLERGFPEVSPHEFYTEDYADTMSQEAPPVRKNARGSITC